jgi:hypothetical protein
MSLLIAWILANETLVVTILFALSELLGANSKVKANGILSLIIIQAQKFLKSRGAKDITP